MNKIAEIWKNYNSSSELLKEKLGRTSNLVGEYAEYLVKEYLGGELLTASSASADIKASNGDLHQVKSRKISNNLTTQLGIIRSWNFDFLTIILFDKNGTIIKSLICKKSISEQYAIYNEHQNGWVISTTDKFLNDENHIDITKDLRELNNDLSTNIEYKTYKKETTKHFQKIDISELDTKEIEIDKVQRKLPKWFRNPNYICSQILINFLELDSGLNYVDYDKLSHSCRHIKTFKSNFAQMINFGEKNHGKVFEKTNSIVTIWNPIKADVMFEYENYKSK
jgi:hypothetical protein